MDLAFYHNEDIYVYYNRHIPKEIGEFYSESYLCKALDEVDDTTDIFLNYDELDMVKIAAGGNKDVTIQSLSNIEGDTITLSGIVNPTSNSPKPYPGRIRHSDINIDGLPDLFITLEFQKPNLE